MKIEKFEDIISWKKAKALTILIYKTMKENKDFGFKDQIQRAAISVMNNIAEGFERGSDKEFIKFLYYAKGSIGEIRSLLYLAVELKYITQIEFEESYFLSIEISKLISGLIKSIR